MDASKPVDYSFLTPHDGSETTPNFRQCSVRGCTHPVAEGSANKMCDVCRSRHRIYASTKRARRKLEKAAVANAVAAQNGLESIGVGSAHEADSVSTTITTSWASGTPEPFTEELSIPNQQQSGVSESNPKSIGSFTNWDAIDPRLFASNLATSSTQHVHPQQSTSSSELANALTLPLPRQATPSQADFALQNDNQDQQEQDIEERRPDESVTSESSGVSTRFCSVKGCKAVVPTAYQFKMCPPCRTRYRTYGVTKRAKWKSERQALDHEMAELQIAEDKRRASEGLPLLADSPEELRIWKLSILEKRLPQAGKTSSHSQSRTPSIHTSPEPEAEQGPVEQPPIEPVLPFGYISPNNTLLGVYPTTVSSANTPYSVSFLPYTQMSNPFLPPMIGPALPGRMCTVSHCHKILPGHYRFKRCEQHRLQNRHHSKLKRFREKAVKALGPEDGATVLDSALLWDGMDDDGNIGHDDYDENSGSASASGAFKRKGKQKATEILELAPSHDPTGVSATSQQSIPPPEPKAKLAKSTEDKQKRSKYSCANDDCHNLLTPGVRWRTCDECRNQDRQRKLAARAVLKASENPNARSKDLTEALGKCTINNAPPTANATRTEETTTGNIVSIESHGAASITPNLPHPLGEDDEEDAEGDLDIDGAGEDLQILQPESQVGPRHQPMSAAAIYPVNNTHTKRNIDDNMNATSIQKLNPRADELELAHPIHRPRPNSKNDPNSPTFNSLTKQRNMKVESTESVKGAFSKFRVDLTSSASAKQGPIYSGFIPKTGSGSNMVQANSITVPIVKGGIVHPEVLADKDAVNVNSSSQDMVQVAESKIPNPVVTVSTNSTPQATSSSSSAPPLERELDKPPAQPPATAPPTGQKKKVSTKGKKPVTNSPSTVPSLTMGFGPYGFPNSYPYYPYFMPTFPYPVAPTVTKNGATVTTKPGPSSSSSSQALSSATQQTTSVPPQYLQYPFLPAPPPPHIAQAYGLGLGFPPSAYPYLPPRYTISNQNSIPGQQHYPIYQGQPLPAPLAQTTKTSKSKASTASSASTPIQPPLTPSSNKVSESDSSALPVPEELSQALKPNQDQPPAVPAATDAPAFAHYHEFESLGDNQKPVRKRRKVDANYLEKYRAIHGFDPPTATPSLSRTVPVMSLNESLQRVMVNTADLTAVSQPVIQPPNSQADNNTRPCARNGCRRTVSQGNLCEKCKHKFKKLQAKVKRKHKLEPQPPLIEKE